MAKDNLEFLKHTVDELEVRSGFRGCSLVIGPLWHLNHILVIIIIMSTTIIKSLSAHTISLS
jgi:hypothetical protein